MSKKIFEFFSAMVHTVLYLNHLKIVMIQKFQRVLNIGLTYLPSTSTIK